MGGFHLGNVVSFLATPIIMSHIGLAGTFAFFASLGYLWIAVWLLNVESDPIDSRTISKSELQLILAGRSKSKVKGDKFPSLREVFSKMGMWAIIVANVINNWVRMVDKHNGKLVVMLSKYWHFSNSNHHAGIFCPTIMDAGVLQNGMSSKRLNHSGRSWCTILL